jgi:D-alanyl-D-alanine dipeptidase
VPAIGNVIAIYTFGEKGIYGVKPPTGINKSVVQAFSAPREFYAPKYEQLKKEDFLKPDLRTLIHWQPKLQTDNQGKASASFYNSDTTGPVQVVVEAISSNGEIGYKEIDLDVKKR